MKHFQNVLKSLMRVCFFLNQILGSLTSLTQFKNKISSEFFLHYESNISTNPENLGNWEKLL